MISVSVRIDGDALRRKEVGAVDGYFIGSFWLIYAIGGFCENIDFLRAHH